MSSQALFRASSDGRLQDSNNNNHHHHHNSNNITQNHNFPILPLYMTRSELEDFCVYQHNIILEKGETIRDHELALDRLDIAGARQIQALEDLRDILIRQDAELADAQRTLRARGHVITACRDNVKHLRRMMAERDDLVTSLSTRVAELAAQREEVDGGAPISPLQLPSPAFSQSSSSSTGRVRNGPSAAAHAVRKRQCSSIYSAPSETPRDAQLNGRLAHRAKRARHHFVAPQDHNSSSSLSSSSSLTTTPSSVESLASETEARRQLDGLQRALTRLSLQLAGFAEQQVRR